MGQASVRSTRAGLINYSILWKVRQAVSVPASAVCERHTIIEMPLQQQLTAGHYRPVLSLAGRLAVGLGPDLRKGWPVTACYFFHWPWKVSAQPRVTFQASVRSTQERKERSGLCPGNRSLSFPGAQASTPHKSCALHSSWLQDCVECCPVRR